MQGHFFCFVMSRIGPLSTITNQTDWKGIIEMTTWFGNAESLKKLKPIKITVTSNTPSPEALERFSKKVDEIARNYVDQNLKHTA